ncbi:serine/threonine-protein kinase pkn1 [mine drainage metagenome]|uniref:Serine/threonine-protein kinase pkn1 n=1 Tax=mine drainage metagenome TaxID=410659 RepID=A0A1J5RRH1_9ZZZZ
MNPADHKSSAGRLRILRMGTPSALWARLLLPGMAAVLLALPSAAPARAEAPADMVLIPAGLYTPALRNAGDATQIPIAAFYLDEFPVTNAQFLVFVRAHPQWRRSRVARLFADGNYLSNWAGDLAPGPLAPPDAPVVDVSWFAAEAYAAAAGKRLPSTNEWEYAFSAGYTTRNAGADTAFQHDLYAWLALPSPAVLPGVRNARANTFGVRAMVGYVWEWVDDFNSALLTASSGSGDSAASSRVCGSGGFSAGDLTNYAAFMRIALRSSLKARDTVSSLGFRCARDAAP